MSCPRRFEPVDDAHLQSCADCRAVRQALSQPPPSVDFERLKAAALAELKSNPRVRPWWMSALGVSGVCATVAAVGLWWFSPNTVQHASMTLRQLSWAAWVMAMLGAGFLAIRPGGRGLRVALLFGVAGCFGLTLAAASGHDLGHGSPCALIEWSMAALPLALAMGVLTRFSFEATRALCAGVAASSAGILAIHLHCPNGTLWHQAVGHLSPIAGVALFALLLRRLLSSRSHAP